MVSKTMSPFMWILFIAFWIIPFGSFFSDDFSPSRIFGGVVFGVLSAFLWIFVSAFFVALKNIKLYEVLDRSGFSIEYLRTFEKKYILGRRPGLQYASEYAEILVNIGQPEDALKYLSSITVPQSAPLHGMANYFYIYVIAALKSGNVPLAENMCLQYRDFFHSKRNSRDYSSVSVIIRLAPIYTDCYAERTERAYRQTLDSLNECDGKYSLMSTINLKLMLLYELTVLEKTEEAEELKTSLWAEIERYEPLFAALYDKLIADFQKASHGEIPL